MFVPTMADLVRARTSLSDVGLDWLHLLVADWHLLADLSFADLLLWVPTSGGERFVAVAQVRPSTGPTCYLDDRVGREVEAGSHPAVRTAWQERRIYREGDPDWRDGTPVREEAIPVRAGDRVLGVVTRETNLATARTPSRLELTYLDSAADLAEMIAEGGFPFPRATVQEYDVEPRVGDGLIRLDAQGRVRYASPNALSAYRRLGLAGDLGGAHLAAVTAALVPAGGGSRESAAAVAVADARSPRSGEVDVNGSVVRLRAIPLTRGGGRIGALVLVQDVTELRRRDRQLLGKDATIREIHHRVKNNLQTVAALLRLQSRRLAMPEARAALEESVRRVSSIALVHETLSHTAEELVSFDEVADRVLEMVRELSLDSRSVEIRRAGRFGLVAGAAATSLAMVLTELLQNAVEHGFAGRLGGGTGVVEVVAERDAGGLVVRVRDDGVGLPPDFALDRSGRLGLQIVRTLLTGELGGGMELTARTSGGTEAVVRLPAAALVPAPAPP